MRSAFLMDQGQVTLIGVDVCITILLSQGESPREANMKMQTKLLISISGLLLSLFSLLSSAVPNPPEVDPTNIPFYQNVPDVTNMNRGDIVRWEVTQMDDSIFHGTPGIRVMYVSENINGDKVAATQMVFYPGTASSPSSDGQWRTMVWATGTVGIGDVCVNSRYPYMYQYNPELWQGRWKPYGDVVYEMIRRGFITVAPDYIGSGPEVNGLNQSYLNRAVKTNAIIDGVRAAKTLFSLPEHQAALNGQSISTEFGVLGHSDGATAAHAMVDAIETLNDPNLQLVGVAPFSSSGRELGQLIELGTGIHPTLTGAIELWPYIITVVQGVANYADALGLSFDKREMLPDGVYYPAEAANAWDACWEDLFSGVLLSEVQGPPYLKSDWDTSPVVQSWLADSQPLVSQSTIPRWVHYGTSDPIATWEPDFVQDLCNNNNPVYWTITNKTHDQTLQNVPKTLDWFAGLFDGQTPALGDHQLMSGGCNVPQ